MSAFRIGGLRYHAASSIDQRAGLLGWASFLLNDSLRISSVAVRRTRAGATTLAFPTRRDGYGIEHPIVCPISHSAHRDIEVVVLDELRAQGVLP